MANLVQQHYLHSHKWTFFKYMQGEAGSDIVLNYKTSSLKRTIGILDKLLSRALLREQEFYNDFNVFDAKSWSAKYLINNNNNSDEAKILKVINSREMISLLSTGGKDFQKTKEAVEKQITEMIKKNKIPEQIANVLLEKSKSSTAKTIGELFSDMGILGSGSQKIGKISLSNKEIQKAFLLAGGLTYQQLPKKVLSGIGSQYLKIYKEKIIKIEQSALIRMNNAIDFLRRRLFEEGLSQNKIDIVVKAFEFEARKNIQGENRLVSTAENLVTGEVSEVGEVVAYINFDDPFETTKSGKTIKNIKSRVIQAGRETKKGQKSKVDTIWVAPRSGKQYHIQNKNSNSDIYRAFQLENDANKLLDIPTYLPIQGDVSLEHLLEQLKSKGYLAPSDADMLIYLLINYNVLNSYETLAKGQNKDGVAPADKTKNDIDAIISQAIHYFISDTDPLDDTSEGLLGNYASTDFFIFMDRVLIPKSLIITKLKEYLTERENSLLRINTTSYLAGFTQADYNDMYYEKTQAIIEEANNSPDTAKHHDYHNENLVSAGSSWGNVARSCLKIRKISIKMQTKNLMNLNLI